MAAEILGKTEHVVWYFARQNEFSYCGLIYCEILVVFHCSGIICKHF